MHARKHGHTPLAARRKHTAQEAGIPAKFAPTIGIAVDHRRRNRSLEGLQVRVTARVECPPHPLGRTTPRARREWGRVCSRQALTHAWAHTHPVASQHTVEWSAGACAGADPPLPRPTRTVSHARTTQGNVARLKAYRSSLVIFPRDAKKPKVGPPAVHAPLPLPACKHARACMRAGAERIATQCMDGGGCVDTCALAIRKHAQCKPASMHRLCQHAIARQQLRQPSRQ